MLWGVETEAGQGGRGLAPDVDDRCLGNTEVHPAACRAGFCFTQRHPEMAWEQPKPLVPRT